MENNTDPESFIIQNVTLGPHFVSDVRLNFGPLQAIDLTWEDPKVIKASKDLRNSLRLGLLKQITPEQFENIEQKAATREKNELMKQQRENKLQQMEVDGREMEVETIDAEKAYSKDKTVSTAGYANDSLSYATALDIAQTQAELRGEELSVEEFAERVQRDPQIVSDLIAQQKNLNASSSISGDTRRGRAYVATAPDGLSNNSTSVKEMKMTNLNKDGYIAGGDFDYLNTPDDGPIAEAIDLEFGDDGDGDKGSVRRI
jgi:hypothetical protein